MAGRELPAQVSVQFGEDTRSFVIGVTPNRLADLQDLRAKIKAAFNLPDNCFMLKKTRGSPASIDSNMALTRHLLNYLQTIGSEPVLQVQLMDAELHRLAEELEANKAKLEAANETRDQKIEEVEWWTAKDQLNEEKLATLKNAWTKMFTDLEAHYEAEIQNRDAEDEKRDAEEEIRENEQRSQRETLQGKIDQLQRQLANEEAQHTRLEGLHQQAIVTLEKQRDELQRQHKNLRKKYALGALGAAAGGAAARHYLAKR